MTCFSRDARYGDEPSAYADAPLSALNCLWPGRPGPGAGGRMFFLRTEAEAEAERK